MPKLTQIIPAVCGVSVTNVCNATCDFCSFAHNKGLVKHRQYLDRHALARALPILYRRGIRYVNFQGGEPLLHPQICGLVADARSAGMHPSLITNGWQLPRDIKGLADAGLANLLVSIDSASMAEHENNRGLRGVGERIESGLMDARRRGIPTIASVTVNRMLCFEKLPHTLRRLGFDAVTFSYPRRIRFGSSSLVYSEESPLVDFNTDELLDALDRIQIVRRRFPVLNPAASVAEMQRHLRGEKELFPCVGGYKYFYVDWNLDIWRCEAWDKPMGSVFDLEQLPDRQDRCTACMMSCYRDTSTMMHGPLAAVSAVAALGRGRPGEAIQTLFRRSVALSLAATARELGMLLRLGHLWDSNGYRGKYRGHTRAECRSGDWRM